LSLFSRLFGPNASRARYQPLYDAIVAAGRDPDWYREGQVPDTVTGRFDMIAALFAIVMLRLEAEGQKSARASALLTEIFVADMEGSIRQLGISDLKVGKHLGQMMSALGGRLSAFRDADDLTPPVRRNIFHEEPPSEAAVAFVAGRLAAFRDRLSAAPLEPILAGTLPPL
jgi:cytochrome b pre-mRNA-processing protein 3